MHLSSLSGVVVVWWCGDVVLVLLSCCCGAGHDHGHRWSGHCRSYNKKSIRDSINKKKKRNTHCLL